MRKELKTAPINPAITLATAKLLAYVKSDSRDAEFQEFVTDAISFCEKYTGKALIDSTWTVWYDARNFDSAFCNRGYLYLDTLNVNSITSVTTYDADNNATVVSSDEYYLSGDRLVLNSLNSFYSMRNIDSISVEVEAGYGADEDAVPASLKSAIAALALYFFNTKGVSTDDNPYGAPYSVISKLEIYKKNVSGVI